MKQFYAGKWWLRILQASSNLHKRANLDFLKWLFHTEVDKTRCRKYLINGLWIKWCQMERECGWDKKWIGLTLLCSLCWLLVMIKFLLGLKATYPKRKEESKQVKSCWKDRTTVASWRLVPISLLKDFFLVFLFLFFIHAG